MNTKATNTKTKKTSINYLPAIRRALRPIYRELGILPQMAQAIDAASTLASDTAPPVIRRVPCTPAKCHHARASGNLRNRRRAGGPLKSSFGLSGEVDFALAPALVLMPSPEEKLSDPSHSPM